MLKNNIRLMKIAKTAMITTVFVVGISSTVFAGEQKQVTNFENLKTGEEVSPIETTVSETIEIVEKQIAKDEAKALKKQQQKEAKAKEEKAKIKLGQKVADYACKYVGILPYVWAGASLTDGVDCSGFTMAVYEKFGYELSHDSDVQSTQGKHVELEDARAGDIVVYEGHVAMYIGDGQIVHAANSGECVKISDVNYAQVLDVRRIIE